MNRPLISRKRQFGKLALKPRQSNLWVEIPRALYDCPSRHHARLGPGYADAACSSSSVACGLCAAITFSASSAGRKS